jgi:hypothetical protein
MQDELRASAPFPAQGLPCLGPLPGWLAGWLVGCWLVAAALYFAEGPAQKKSPKNASFPSPCPQRLLALRCYGLAPPAFVALAL